MPKLKTKSSVKKRFSLTGSGKVKRNYAGKRHFMRRRTKRFIRGTRGTTTVDAVDVPMIKRLLPYG
jgi:large subunit ribosomal protein L35